MLAPFSTARTAAAGDPADRLPEHARERLLRLCETREELLLVVRSISDDSNEIRLERQREEAHLRRITEQVTPEAGGGRRLGDDDGPVRTSTAKIERLAKDLARLQERHAAASARLEQVSRLLSNINAWLGALPPTAEIRSHVGEPLKMRRGETAGGARERLDAERNALLAAVAATSAAPLPRDEIKRRVRDQVEQAARGAISINGRGEVTWPRIVERLDLFAVAQVPVAGFAAGEVVDTLAVLAHVHRAALVAAIEREVDRLDNTGALSDGERASRLEALNADLLDIERAEAALAEQASELPRSDIDARAYLGVVTC